MSADAAAAYDAWYATPLGAAFVAARGERPPTSPASSSPTGSTGAASTTRKEQRTP